MDDVPDASKKIKNITSASRIRLASEIINKKTPKETTKRKPEKKKTNKKATDLLRNASYCKTDDQQTVDYNDDVHH